MIYKHFRLAVFVRVIVIVGLALLLAFVVMRKPSLFIPMVIALLLVIAVINIIWYIEKSNRDLTHFLLSIRQGAFTESYASGHRGKRFDALSDALDEVAEEFSKVNLEKELHYQYLEALNENINMAIFSFDTAGKLKMMNSAARRLLSFPPFSHIQHFKKIDQHLHEAVRRIRPGERILVTAFIREEQHQLSVQLKEIILQGQHIRIIFLQNLNAELEAKEIEAWHRLMRVIAHEIMNSVTPVVSLTTAMQTILHEPGGIRKTPHQLSPENMDDIFHSVDTISSRSKGLLKFVNAYREYAKPLQFHLEPTDLSRLISRIVDLLHPDIQKANIQIHIRITPDSMVIRADQALLEQVIINLLKNAMEAVAHDGAGKIVIQAQKNNEDNVQLSIADNGPGIDPETVSKIFIPFFTTKARGSGIGLSLSRQIIRSHGGHIDVNSTLGKGSVFVVRLPVN